MLVAGIMGFYAGLPLLLTGSVLQAWMRESGIDLATIGVFALVGLPYTLKFLWAPLLDRFSPTRLGRRRSWLLIAQLLLVISLVALAYTNPALSTTMVAVCAMIIAFFSATQDAVIDAYRRESLTDSEQGLAASFYVNGYRVGMLLASGGGLIIADMTGFHTMYLGMAAVMATAIPVTLLAAEPAPHPDQPKTLNQAVVQPFVEFLKRKDAVLILLFIVLYKSGDTMASHMTMPFYLDIGFSKTEIAAIVKLFGFWATILGGILGGILILRIGIYAALWLFGILQAVSTAGFAVLANIGASMTGLAAVISFENISGGMGTAAFIAYMASQTDKRFSATQYALLSSLMGVPRVLIAVPTGKIAELFGWQQFFLICTAAAIPGLLLLLRLRR
ncbi:MAG TPA: MFS transporter [Crenotrichaceae bacterium]|nr:MFS transporter [Crenotrichaceae bacterium]